MKTLWHRPCSVDEKIIKNMKDQIKNQVTSDKFQQEASFIGDHEQVQNNVSSAAFKNAENMKRTLPSGMQKKINPRLLIL